MSIMFATKPTFERKLVLEKHEYKIKLPLNLSFEQECFNVLKREFRQGLVITFDCQLVLCTMHCLNYEKRYDHYINSNRFTQTTDVRGETYYNKFSLEVDLVLNKKIIKQDRDIKENKPWSSFSFNCTTEQYRKEVYLKSAFRTIDLRNGDILDLNFKSNLNHVKDIDICFELERKIENGI